MASNVCKLGNQRAACKDVGHNQSKQATTSKGRPSNQLAEILDSILANGIAAVHPVISFKGQNFLSFTMDSFNVHGAATFHQANAAVVQAWQSTWATTNQRFHQSKQQQLARSNNSKFLNKSSQQQGGDALGHQQGSNFTFNSSNFSTCKLRPCSHHVQAKAATNVQTVQHGFVEAMAAKAARRRECGSCGTRGWQQKFGSEGEKAVRLVGGQTLKTDSFGELVLFGLIFIVVFVWGVVVGWVAEFVGSRGREWWVS
ncbi:hypothetical protein ACLOJK_036636 [Asimina triloba]